MKGELRILKKNINLRGNGIQTRPGLESHGVQERSHCVLVFSFIVLHEQDC